MGAGRGEGRGEGKGEGKGEGGGDAVRSRSGVVAEPGELYSVSSPNTASGPEGQSPALPSFSAAFCKALS